jgi:hypothetical protein
MSHPGLPYPAAVTNHESAQTATDTAVPLRPVYPYVGVGAPIELYSGDISVGGADRLPGHIYADLAGDLQVRWSVTEPKRPFETGDVDLTLHVPDLGPTTVPARVYDRWGAGLIMDANVGSPGAMCDRVIAHFTNLPWVFPWGTRRLKLSGAGWELTLDGRHDHSEIYKELRTSLFFVVPHVGELRLANGRSFPASKANVALEAFQVALSFALARYIAPVAPVGFDTDGHRVWEQWASWRCAPVDGYLPWWDRNNGERPASLRETVRSGLA